MKEILINAQWQGGADRDTFNGAKELEELYLAGYNYTVIPISADEAEMSVTKNEIRGFDALGRQMQAAYDHLREKSPDSVFTLGGGCDADGLYCKEVSDVIETAADKLVGLGIYEYVPTGIKNSFIEKLIRYEGGLV